MIEVYARAPGLTLTWLPEGGFLLRASARGVGFKVGLPVVELLTFCGDGRSEDEIRGRFGDAGVRVARQLAEAGALAAPHEVDATPAFFDNFASLDVHRRMLGDATRMAAYADAIAATVRPGMRVLDAGTGTGVLACLAAKAGASVVYAVDASDILDVARGVVRASGLEGVVKPIRGDFRSVQLPTPVDLVITETFGAWALAENGLDDLAACVAKHLAPGGAVLPERVDLLLAPVRSAALAAKALGAFLDFRGVALGGLRAGALGRAIPATVEPAECVAPGATALSLRMGYDPGEGAARVSFAGLSGRIDGFAAWFDVALAPGHALSTAPDAPATHWEQCFLPVAPFEVPPGAEVVLDVAIGPAPDDRRGLLVDGTLAVGGEERQVSWRFR